MWEYDIQFYEDGNTKEECGIVAGEDIIIAIQNLCERFGADNIEEVNISFIRDDKVLPYKETSGKSLKHLFEEI